MAENSVSRPARSTSPSTADTAPQIVTGLSNREFLERYAGAGRIGLSGGISLIDRAICRAQRHLDPAAKWGSWSHAFVFQGPRADNRQWVIESDLQVHRKHVQLGVQENRITKYFDEELYTSLAVLDFGLTETQVSALLVEALDLAANRERYSVRELFGTLLALRHPKLRGKDNLMARDRSMYCSAFVQHLFRKIGLDLSPEVDLKNTTPEDIARTVLPHASWVLTRDPAKNKLTVLSERIRDRAKSLKGRKKRADI